MQPKNKLTATLFAFLLGGVGVHDFYLGYKSKGILHVVLYAVGVGLACFGIIPYVGWVVACIGTACASANSIWALVEAIMIVSKHDYCDAYGIPMEWPHN